MEHRSRIILPYHVGGPVAQHKALGKALLLAGGKARDHEVAEAKLRRTLAHQVQHFIFRLDCGTVHAGKEISIRLGPQDQPVMVAHNFGHHLPARAAGASRKILVRVFSLKAARLAKQRQNSESAGKRHDRSNRPELGNNVMHRAHSEHRKDALFINNEAYLPNFLSNCTAIFAWLPCGRFVESLHQLATGIREGR